MPLRFIPSGYHSVRQGSPESPHYCTKHQRWWVDCIAGAGAAVGGAFWAVHCLVFLIEPAAPAAEAPPPLCVKSRKIEHTPCRRRSAARSGTRRAE